jgi:alkanesulfonate monooxygenase SsuD/methylene tetrahydromethanopterin reductase-like flavin-dependent oxidoreductase (luciferase family)
VIKDSVRTQPALGIQLSGMMPSHARALAEVAELMAELESVGATDVVYGEHLLYASKMVHPTGRQLGRVERTSYVGDVLVLFAAIAARTSHMRLCTSVVLAALHEPALLARQAATLSDLSGGRFVMGVGSGWSDERFARMEEVVGACRALWSSAPASFQGKYVHFDDVISDPAPVGGDVPVWWAGKATPTTARRVVCLGDGWVASEASAETDIAAGIELIGRRCADEGRDPGSVGIRATLPRPAESFASAGLDERIAHARAGIERYARLGVTHVTIPLGAYSSDRADGTKLVAALA